MTRRSYDDRTADPLPDFDTSEDYARHLDEADPLSDFRCRFHIPRRPDGTEVIYFCGNSLGLQPKGVRKAVENELADWARLGVDAHFHGRHPWYSYHEIFIEPGARLVGARPGEVVMMNSLTVNLHLMMATFYRPTPQRFRILIEEPAFPSDRYAVQTQARFHGFDPEDAIVSARPRPGENCIRAEDVEALLAERADEIALVLLSGVNFYTGQVLPMQRITAAARARGCAVGWDLAHAAGNVPLALHDWGPDFAVWCSYKYLNAGPGAVAGCFVHHRHADNPDLLRLGGWWGNDPATRFDMDRQRDFIPQPGAAGWQVSNPPILAMAPLRVSLTIFEEAGIDALRARSLRMVDYLRRLLAHTTPAGYEILTPADPDEHGCQTSFRLGPHARRLYEALCHHGIVCDFRSPDVIRIAPVPLYNRYHEIWRFVDIWNRLIRATADGPPA